MASQIIPISSFEKAYFFKIDFDFFALSTEESLDRLLYFGYETISCSSAAVRTNF